MSETTDKPLSVAVCSFIEDRDMDIDEIFGGYDELKVITFSYDLNFITSVSRNFGKVEILLGCENIIGEDAGSLILATQGVILKEIRKHTELLDRAVDGSVTFKTSHNITSHQKIYLMRADDGRCRVLTGSANFSRRGFSGPGIQGETYAIFDNDEKAYEYNLAIFDAFEENCDEVTLDTLYVSDSDKIGVDELPISKTVKAKNVGVIVEKSKADPEEVEYITDTTSLAHKYAGLIKEAKTKPDPRSKKLLIKPQFITELRKLEKSREKEESQKRKDFPHLYVDFDNVTASFNDSPYNLTDIPEDKVKGDFQILTDFFNGYDNFIGKKEQAKQAYYKMLIFMFLSPFMAMLRDCAHRNGFAEEYFPYFAIIGGKKDAGKTQFVTTVQYLMTGKNITPAPTETWTKSGMAASLGETQGFPVCIDDVQSDYFKRNAGGIAKCDAWVYTENLIHHGTYVITTNEIESIPKELAKRMYYVKVPITLQQITARDNKKKMSDMKQKMSTALYSAFLAEMIPAVNDICYRMDTFDSDTDEDWRPDIFATASNALISLADKYGTEKPEWMIPLTYDDYFGYNDTVRDIHDKLIDEWEHNNKAFNVVKKDNRLEYTPGERSYQAQRICDQLPETLEAEVSGISVVMKLDKAREFFGLPFKKKLFAR